MEEAAQTIITGSEEDKEHSTRRLYSLNLYGGSDSRWKSVWVGKTFGELLSACFTHSVHSLELQPRYMQTLKYFFLIQDQSQSFPYTEIPWLFIRTQDITLPFCLLSSLQWSGLISPYVQATQAQGNPAAWQSNMTELLQGGVLSNTNSRNS